MENHYKKWVNLSFLALGVLVAYVFFAMSIKISALYDVEARIRNIDLIIRGASFGVGGILFFVLLRHERASQFMNEVMVELSRVTWPTQKETSNATFIVIIMVLISGVILGLLDYVWTMMLKGIL